jgi:hypothetical protein
MMYRLTDKSVAIVHETMDAVQTYWLERAWIVLGKGD